MVIGRHPAANPFRGLFRERLMQARTIAGELPIDPLLGPSRASIISSLRDAIELSASIPPGRKRAKQILQVENSYRQAQLQVKAAIEILNANRPADYYELHRNLVDISAMIAKAVLVR